VIRTKCDLGLGNDGEDEDQGNDRAVHNSGEVMIPVNEPLLDGREAELLFECIKSGWISSDGPFVKEFEEGFAAYVGVKYGIAVCNGTAALEAALYAAGVGEGDMVMTPTFTIISCAIAALRLGARPVLVDIEPQTWCMDVEHLEAVVDAEAAKGKGGLKAIMPVHIYGHPVDMDPILEIADRHGLVVIEDAAEVHGAEYLSRFPANEDQKRTAGWRKCGSMGHVAAFSFYANKILTTGEGGMVVTNDPSVAERARSYRNLCFKPERRFYHTDLGYNFRMTNLQAAVGLAQLERIEQFIARKRFLGAYYRHNLADIPGIRFQIEKPWARSVYWMYAIELDPSLGLDAETLQRRLKEKGIGTRPFFLGLHAQPALQQMNLGFDRHGFPRADHAYRYGCYLPSGMTLTEKQVDTVCVALREALEQR
jgi:perosamine synthetase